jgi:hypothetical protein
MVVHPFRLSQYTFLPQAQTGADGLTWIVFSSDPRLNSVQLQLSKSFADERFRSGCHEPSAGLRLRKPIAHCRTTIDLLDGFECNQSDDLAIK